MNSVVGQQFRTASAKTTVGGRPLHPREPTVRVERLEFEVHRYGRIVPTSNGSYHILDTSTPEGLSEGSVHSFSKKSKAVGTYCSVVDVNVAVNRVGRKTNRVTGATDRASGVHDTTNSSNITDDNYDCTIDLDGAHVSSQMNNAIHRSYSKDNHFKKSAHEYGRWGRDLTIYAGSSSSSSNSSSSSTSSGNDAGLKHVSTDRQYFLKEMQERWEPIYEPISDADSESDSTKGTILSKKQMDDLVSTKHVNLHCDNSGNSAGQSRHCSITDIRKDPAEGVKARRHSAPDNPLRKRIEEERKQKRHRRWSFSMESDMSQTDRRETAKKLYLNRLLLSKDAKIDSWNVFIDIAHDEHTIEEFEFPEPKGMVVKEEKEDAVSAVLEQNSSGIEHSARVASPCNKEKMCGESPCSEFNQELNTEGEDTIEASKVFINVPINQAYSTRNMLGELPVSDREDRSHIPKSAPNNSVIVSSSGILNEAKGKCELSSENPETQTTEACILTKSLIENSKAKSNVPAEAILPDDKSSLYAVKVMSPVEYYPRVNALCVKCEKGECVQHISCNSAEGLNTHGRYNREARYQNTKVASKNTKGPIELSANIKTDVCRNSEPGMRRRISSQESSSGTTTYDASKNAKYGHRTADSLLANTEEVSDVCSTYANTEKSVPVNSPDCDCSFGEWSRLVPKANSSNTETDKERLSRNSERHPLAVSPSMSPQHHVSGEENIKRKSGGTSNLRSHGEPKNDLEEKENENCSNDSEKEVVIRENTDQRDTKRDVDRQIESQNTADVSKMVRGYCELSNGNKGSPSPEKTKRRRTGARLTTTKRAERDSKKEESDDEFKIRVKQQRHRKPRYSRRSFRHDSIQVFEVSTAFPPQNTHVPWRFNRKKPEFPDRFNPKIASPPSPIMNPSHTQLRFDDGVTNIEIEDDIPSPGSLTIDLGDQNTNASELSNAGEDDRSRRQSNIGGSDAEEDVVSPVTRRTPSEGDCAGTKKKTHQGRSPNSDPDQNQTGDIFSESSDEAQNKKKRKRAKKRKADDASATASLTEKKLTAQMQEKGRRLAQELPGFNWLEEKIRNGGVPTVLPPKRLSGGSVVDPPDKSIPASETARSVTNRHVSDGASDAARSSVLPTPSSPPERRNCKRLQEYLLRPPKRARVSPTGVSEVADERQEMAPSLQSTRQHAEPPSAPLAPAPGPPVQPLHYPQQRSPRRIQPPRPVTEREDSPPHNQSSRRPVIVSGSELAKRSDVSPLLKQLTSGGELEVTLSTPSSLSSGVSESSVVSQSSHRTSSDDERPATTHVSVTPVNAGSRQQYAEERPRDAPQHPSASCRRISYAVEQLSQPYQPKPRIFRPYEHIPVYVRNAEPSRWPGDVPARRVQDSSNGSADAPYSDRIATMARHAATSFDTGFGMGLAVSPEASHRVVRHQQHRPPDSAQQPTTYHREHVLRPSGYLPPHVQQPGAYDFRLWQPSYVVPQQSAKPQIVRPSAQYPVGVGSCHPSHACSPTCTAASNSQVFFPGIAQHSSTLVASDPSVFSPYASRRKADSSMSPTSTALLSTHSSSVQETASETPQTPSSAHNQAQIPGRQNEAHTSDPENQAVISDPLAKEKNPPKDIEEIRKAAEAAVEELEKLGQLKETTKKNFELLRLAEQQAIKELARTQKQLEEAVGVHHAGKAVEPRTAVPAATAASSESSKTILHVAFPVTAQERHQPLVQDTQKSAQRPYNTGSTNGSSITDFHILLPAVTQEISQSAAACENHQLGVGCKHHQSDITQNNLQSGGAHWNKQSAFTHENHPPAAARENHQSGAACGKQQSYDACQNQWSEVTCENHPSEAACKNQQSAAAGENCQLGPAYKSQQPEVGHENHQSGAACKNEELSVVCDNNQLENGGKNENSAVTHDDCRSRVTCKNLPTQQKCSVTSDSTVTSIQGLSETFPSVVQANQKLESTRDSLKTQQKQSVSPDSTRSSVPVLNKTLETVMEKESSVVANENSQKQQVPSCSAGSTDSSIPKLHTKIPIDKSENNLTQQKLTVSSNSTGNSLTQLNLTFPAVAHEKHQSDPMFKNHELQQKVNVTSDNTRSSVPALNVPLPAAVPVNKQSGVGCDNQQSENACRNHTRHELSATLDNRLTGSSVPGLNGTYPGLAQENQQSGFACRSQRQRDACGQYQSAVPFESCPSVQRTNGTVDTSRSSIPGLHVAYPTVTCAKYQSQQKPDVSVISITRNSAPELLTTHPRTGYQNQEAVPRPLPPSLLLVRPPLPVPAPLPQQQPPIQTVPVSHQMTHSQSQPPIQTVPVSHQMTHSQSQPPIQTVPVSHQMTHSQSQPPIQTVPVSHQMTHSQSQPAPHVQAHSAVLHPHPVKGAHPPLPPSHSKFSSVSRPSVNPQLPHTFRPLLYPQLPVSQAALKSQLLSVSQTSQFQSSPVSRESQSVVISRTLPHLHSLSKTQTAPHYESSSVESPSDVSVIAQFRSVQQSSVITQEPHVNNTSTSNRLHSSTVEEYPIDLSIGKQKSVVEDKNKPSVCVTAVVPPPCQRNEQNNPAQRSTSPEHHQGRSQVQASVVHNPSSEEHNVMNNSSILCHNYRMPHSHTSQLQSPKNSGDQQQLQTSMQTDSKGRYPLLAALVSTADNSAGRGGLGRRRYRHRVSVGEHANRQKHFETPRDQNVDGDSVLHRKHVHIPTHHEMAHYSQHDVHQYNTHTHIPSSSYIPSHHKTVVHGLQSEQQQRNHTADIHTVSAVSSRRDMYWSANKQVSSTMAIAPDRPAQDARSMAGEHSFTRSQLVCGYCNQTAKFMCSACHNEWYCSTECQLRHWNYHSVDCSHQHQNEDE